MTATEVAFPVGATTQELVDKNGTTYDVSDHTVTRTGEDGDIPILHLFVGDSFNGEILEGGWRKGWDSNMDADQAFVAKLDTANGELDLLGEADVAGTAGSGWINQNNPIPLIDDTVIVFDMVLPWNDTGITGARDTDFKFYLIPNSIEATPASEPKHIRFDFSVDENGLLFRIYRDSGSTLLFDGSTKDGNSTRSDTAHTFWKFRITFNGKPGTNEATMKVEAKTGTSRANMEADIWEELYDTVGSQASPYDISDLTFHVAYPCYRIYSQNTTVFDDASPATSGGITVNYPQFDVNWGDDTITDDGSVMLFDGDPDSGGVRVYSKEHTFG